MKYIINESQYKLLLENNIATFFRRRVSVESLKPYIRNGIREYPHMCEMFEDPEEYAETVIWWAVDEFINIYNYKFTEDDEYTDTVDYLRSFCSTHFGQSLVDGYILTCDEK